MAALEALERELPRPGVLRVGLRGAAMQRARELVEHDDQREARAGLLGPTVQLAPTGGLEHRPVALDDGLVGAAAEPALELPAVGLLVRIEPRREPEPEDLLRRWRRHRPILASPILRRRRVIAWCAAAEPSWKVPNHLSSGIEPSA